MKKKDRGSKYKKKEKKMNKEEEQMVERFHNLNIEKVTRSRKRNK